MSGPRAMSSDSSAHANGSVPPRPLARASAVRPSGAATPGPTRNSMRRAAVVAAAAGSLVLGIAVLPSLAQAASSSAFTAGDLVVYRVGDGSSSLGSGAAPVFLDEYSPSGTLVESVPLPTSASGSNHEFTDSGSAGSDGLLTLSGDGRYLLASGYNQAVGTGNVASTDDVTVARVAADGTVDTSTELAGLAGGNNIRGAASSDGNDIWVSGAQNGIVHTTVGSSSYTELNTSDTNFRQVAVVDGQLYASSNKNSLTVASVGTGLPTTGGQTVSNLPGNPDSGGDPYAFALVSLSGGSTPDTVYVADSTAGKIDKYSLTSGSWKSEGSVSVSDVTGVTAQVVGGKAVVYATTSGSSSTSGTLYTVTDSAGAGSSMSGTVTKLATAGSKEAFRGVAFAPGTTASSPTPTTSATPTPPASPTPTASPTAPSSPTSSPSASPTGSTKPTVSASVSTLLGTVSNTINPTLTLTVADAYYGASAVTLSAKSSSTSVVPSTGLVFSGSGATRTLTVTPKAAGYSTLTITATGPDGSTASTTVSYAASIAVPSDPNAFYWSGAGNGSAMVDAGGGYTLVGDDESNVLRLYQNGVSGPPVKTFDFTSELPDGSDEIDIEAAARVGNRIYWTGSMSNSSSGNLEPARSTLFATDITGSGANTTLTWVGSYSGLRSDLIAWDQAGGSGLGDNALGFAASAASGVGGHLDNSFNVEGLEFAPGSTTTAYLGFRGPLETPATRSNALMVPVTNIDQLVTGGASKATFGAPIEADLGGLGVRDIRKNADSQYIIVAGSADETNTDFQLYTWDGVPADAPKDSSTVLPVGAPTGAWESIDTVPDPLVAGSQLTLLQDDGNVVWYNDGNTSKSGLSDDEMKDLGDTFTYEP